MQNSSVRFLGCDLNAAASTGQINTYVWRYRFAGQDITEETASPSYRPQNRDCGFFGNLNNNRTTVGSVSFVQMIVDLRVRDAQGNLSDVRSNQNVRIFPQNNCGAAF